jgi:hypothetical protein
MHRFAVFSLVLTPAFVLEGTAYAGSGWQQLQQYGQQRLNAGSHGLVQFNQGMTAVATNPTTYQAAGTAVGAYYGGPAGAAAGYQIGGAFGAGVAGRQPAQNYAPPVYQHVPQYQSPPGYPGFNQAAFNAQQQLANQQFQQQMAEMNQQAANQQQLLNTQFQDQQRLLQQQQAMQQQAAQQQQSAAMVQGIFNTVGAVIQATESRPQYSDGL